MTYYNLSDDTLNTPERHVQGIPVGDFEIGIVDTRNIVRVINETYSYDFSDYALTSFKRRLENIINTRGYKYPDMLVNKLRTEPDFFDIFLSEIPVESTEMFRDPSLWRVLRESLLNPQAHEYNRTKIWIPVNISGDELYSLCIMLKESGLLDKVQIIASYYSNRNLEQIKTGVIRSSKLEVSEENYKRANGTGQFSDYIQMKNGLPYRDPSLISAVTFTKQNITFDEAPQGVKYLFFRNQMIYANATLQSRILRNISLSMLSGGYLFIGAKESIVGHNDFMLFNEAESIYRRR